MQSGSAQEQRLPLSEAIQLLVIQPTPFCNIQCDYCYLPNRNSRARLQLNTFRELLSKVLASGLMVEPLSIVWHAGEPLALPVSYYAELFGVIDELGLARNRLRHSIQTNGTLLNDAWCNFIHEERINVGVSLDGPAFLNDRHRRDRRGRGTHELTMNGIRLLQRSGIAFHVIAVVTSDSLEYPDEIFDFFLQLGVHRIGFNVEELEGHNSASSLMNKALEPRIRDFWKRLYERQEQSGGAVCIREFERARNAILHGPAFLSARQCMTKSSQVAPFGIVAADWQGNLSSFSPELLGLKSLRYIDFVFGNICDSELLDLQNSPKFQRVAREIYEGVEDCQRTCQYFGLCGGGAPSNKYFENGTFASTETMYCRTSIQMPLDIVLADLEKRLDLRC